MSIRSVVGYRNVRFLLGGGDLGGAAAAAASLLATAMVMAQVMALAIVIAARRWRCWC